MNLPNQKPRLVIIVGPTAVGKSHLSLELASQLNSEIIVADSMQVYKFMDIGTGKPSLEEQRQVRHHLLDIVFPDEEFNAGLFLKGAREIISSFQRGKKAIMIVGGTGLYIKALTQGLFEGPAGDTQMRERWKKDAELYGKECLYERLKEIDPASASRLHSHDTSRIIRALEVFFLTQKSISLYQREHGFGESPFHLFKIGFCMERTKLYKRIEDRIDQMINRGLVEEVKELWDKGYSTTLHSMQGLGYRHISQYLLKRYSFEEAVRLFKRDTRRYAKRQLTWFKADKEIQWISYPFPVKEIKEKIKRFLEG